MEFTKMHGLGNDFILLDLRKRSITGLAAIIKKLSHRRFAIGFDQALILKDSKKGDFRMDIYNADGGKVEMCGNGIRCFAKYIWDQKLSKKKVLEIETLAGIIKPVKDGELIRVDMGEPILKASLIPVKTSAAMGEEFIERIFKAGKKSFKVTCVSMGNPHAVIFVDDVDAFPVSEYGPIIERDKDFPQGTNVEFVEVVNSKRLKMRVWERGSGETLACGTGACAALVAAKLTGRVKRSATVELPGGNLKIELGKDNHVLMTGPAVESFTGTIETRNL
ncbi:MAG: diaminopimelate epimerase [Proteobacteria bacterium]|nr:diaminopimelate epimerase [Pseudomonadota bacterium]